MASAPLEITKPPSDSISRIAFLDPHLKSQPTHHFLIASAWDGTVRLYDTEANELLGTQKQELAVLDCCGLGSGLRCASAGLGSEIRLHDFETNVDQPLGKHLSPIRSLRYDETHRLVFAGSWDKTVTAWDLRSKTEAARIGLEGKVFGMSLTPEHTPYSGKLIVGDSSKRLSIYDLRKFNTPEAMRPEAMNPEEVRGNVCRYQIRCVQALSNGLGFAVGTTEGRVYYEYFDPTVNKPYREAQEGGEGGGPVLPPTGRNLKSYAFRCHREKATESDAYRYSNSINGQIIPGETDKIFPVNDIAFHPKYHTFATAGGDGSVAVWDGESKKRLWKLAKPFPTALTSVAFSSDGTKMALAVSYDFAYETNLQDQKQANWVQLLIKDVRPEDVEPRPSGTSGP